MIIKTLHFRIKDSSKATLLNKMANDVNFVWNYCNDVNIQRWQKFRKTFNKYDLQKLTSGCSNDLFINSQTIQSICHQYDDKRKMAKKLRLNWRSYKRNLGWIPFNGQTLSVVNDIVRYNKKDFKFWLSCPIEGKIKSGSFSQNSKGQWFVNLVIEEADSIRITTGKKCGIDLGLKTLATLSDGTEFNRNNLTKQFEDKLAMAQRAGKKKLVKTIHTKIKNKRKDFNHKVSTQLVHDYDKIVVGNVSSSKLKKTKMAKSVSDAGWSDFKTMLAYKAIRLGVEYKEVNESYSTITCSDCLSKSGPSGLSGLGVREWVCNECGSIHFRDINAAKNILRIGHDTPIKGIRLVLGWRMPSY